MEIGNAYSSNFHATYIRLNMPSARAITLVIFFFSFF